MTQLLLQFPLLQFVALVTNRSPPVLCLVIIAISKQEFSLLPPLSLLFLLEPSWRLGDIYG